jgi:hypothetical protein
LVYLLRLNKQQIEADHRPRSKLMNAVLEVLVLAFASVGLFGLGHRIFRSGWQTLWKVIGVLFVVSLWWAMVSGPIQGYSGSDHGAVTGLLATLGIVLAVTLAIRRYNQGWHPWVITGAALVFLVLIWYPRFDASQAAASQSELSNATQGSHFRPPAPATNDGRHQLNCRELSFEGRQAAGCE